MQWNRGTWLCFAVKTSWIFFSLQDVARLIVERSTIMSHLFSKLSYSAESDAVLVALLSIFSRYIKRMRQSKEGEEVYSWVSACCLAPAGHTDWAG